MDIDFVLPWVDGGDPAWQQERARYAPAADEDGGSVRYREWGTLRYWFRGVETFAPWVRRVHFITWGHLPAWLNVDHPKLHVVRHQDYIPHQYLPTFSSHAIELNMHRIEGLAEHFVYFNDDVFLTGAVAPEDFFSHGLPCDTCRLGVLHARSADDLFGHIQFNNIGLVNDLLSHAQCAQLHRRKWFSPKNGLKSLTRSLPLCHWPYFTGFASPHLAVAYERKTFEQLWAAAPETLEATCRHRFRSMTDVSQLAARAWRLAQGQFTPAKPLGRPYFPDEVDGVQLAINAITRRYFRMICVNDEDRGFDFERERRRLIAAFETLLPQQSAFERCAPGQKEERP